MGEIPFGLEDMSQEDSMHHLAQQREVLLVRACRYKYNCSEVNGRHLEDAADDLTDAMRLALDWVSLEKDPGAQGAVLAEVLSKEAAAHYRLLNVFAGRRIVAFEPASRAEMEADITRELEHSGSQALDSLFESYRAFLGDYRETLDAFLAKLQDNEAARPAPEAQTRKPRIARTGIGAGLLVIGGILAGRRGR